jgi:hypothetical protein
MFEDGEYMGLTDPDTLSGDRASFTPDTNVPFAVCKFDGANGFIFKDW